MDSQKHSTLTSPPLNTYAALSILHPRLSLHFLMPLAIAMANSYTRSCLPILRRFKYNNHLHASVQVHHESGLQQLSGHTTLGAYIVDVISGYDINQFAARSRLDTQQPIALTFYQCLVPADRLHSLNVEVIRLPCLPLIFSHNCQRGGRKNHAVTK